MIIMETCLYQKTFIVPGIWCKKHYNSSLNKWKFSNMETESKDKTLKEKFMFHLTLFHIILSALPYPFIVCLLAVTDTVRTCS